MLRALAAAFALLTLLAAVPSPARAASVLSNGSATPTTGTTATSFTFSVDYLSDDSPRRPAQLVWADVGSTTVTLTKVSGTSHDGTWQGSTTLPVGTWQVTFHATTASDPQPSPLTGPIITVTQAPTPSPTPTPTPTPTPRPTPALPTGPPPPAPTNPPPQPLPSDPTSSPPDDEPDRTRSPSPSGSPTQTASATDGSSRASPSATAFGSEDATPVPTEPPIDNAGERSGGMLASFLIVGGTMSLAGAVVLARQWVITRGHRPR